MKKAVMAALAASLLAGSTFSVVAQAQEAGRGPGTGNRPAVERPSPEDRAIMTQARITALKVALKLTPDQEKLWPAFETALTDAAKNRAARREAMREARNERREAKETPDPAARMRQAADNMTAAAGDLRKIADAADPLYKSLDDGQKKRLRFMMQDLMRGEHGPRPGHMGRPGQRGG